MLKAVSPEHLAGATATELSDALERGEILFFPKCPVPLPGEEDGGLLRGLEGALTRKNVTDYFLADRTIGIDPARKERDQVHLVLRRHLREVISFLTQSMPSS